MNSNLSQWAIRWKVPFEALRELDSLFGIEASVPIFDPKNDQSESYVQSLVRLEAARKGVKLWRNNVGVLFNEKGVPVRYGLGNDSPALNLKLKSGDLIGWRPILVTSRLIGSKIAQFVSRECKRPNWTFTGTDREQAQLKWAEAVNADGGDSQFVQGEGTL